MRKTAIALLLILLGSLPAQATFTFELEVTHSVAIGETWSFIEFAGILTNTGDERDSYTVEKVETLPGDEFDWSASICVGDICYAPQINYVETPSMDPGEFTEVYAAMFVGQAVGTGVATLTVNSSGNPLREAVVQDFTMIHADCDFLIVDAGLKTEDLGGTIMGNIAEVPGVWPLRDEAPELAELQIFAKVFWLGGAATESADEMAGLDAYLSAGGALCVSGQDLAEGLCDPGSPFYSVGNVSWFEDTFGVRYVMSTDSLGVYGEPSDHVGDGLQFQLDGSQTDPDLLSTLGSDPAAVSFWMYEGPPQDNQRIVGVTRTAGPGRLVYLGFGLEGAGTHTQSIVTRVCEVLSDVTGVDDGRTPAQLVRLGNVPNPFNPKTMIRFQAPRSGGVEIAIHDVSGRQVDHLRVSAEAGENAVVWNGTDAAGHALPSGTYFYRISQGSEQVAGKMTLLK